MFTHEPVNRDHMQIIERSFEQDARLHPSGEKQTQHTESVCPDRMNSLSPVEVDHKRISKSFDPDAILLPSGEKHTDSTSPECPVRV